MSFTVFFITNNYKPYSGGVVSSIDATAQALRKKNIRIIIVTLDFGTNEPEEPDVYRLYCPIQFNYKGNPMAIPWGTYKTLNNLIKQYRPSLFHVHHPFLLGPLAVKVAKHARIPVIFTYHTQYEKYLHYIPVKECISRPIVHYILNRFCNNVQSIIAPSQTIASMINVKNYYAPNIIIPSPLAEHYCTNFEHKPAPTKPYKLLCVSRYTPEKNLFFLLDVIKALEYYPLTLTLIGYGSLQQDLHDYAYNTLSLSPQKIHFLIRPPKSQILTAYQQADLFIFASQTETQGLVIAESLSQGTPVIALPGPGINDSIISGYNGYIVSSREEMAHTIKELLNHPHQLIFLQEKARETAKAYYPASIAEKLIILYTNIAKQSTKC